MTLGNIFCTFFSYTFKTYGENKGGHPPISDEMLTWAASIGQGFVSGTSRFLFGTLMDKYSFKSLFRILMGIELLVAVVCYHAAYYPWLFFLCVVLNFMCIGGMFAVFPVAVINVFGLEHGPAILNLIFYGCLIASLIIVLATVYLIDFVGF